MQSSLDSWLLPQLPLHPDPLNVALSPPPSPRHLSSQHTVQCLILGRNRNGRMHGSIVYNYFSISRAGSVSANRHSLIVHLAPKTHLHHWFCNSFILTSKSSFPACSVWDSYRTISNYFHFWGELRVANNLPLGISISCVRVNIDHFMGKLEMKIR